MKPWARETLRWLAIVVCGGIALWLTIDSCHGFFTSRQGAWHDWSEWFLIVFVLGLMTAMTLPFYIVAYYCVRREYRKIFHVLGVVGAVVVCGVLMDLPFRRPVMDFFVNHTEEYPWLVFLGLPVSLLFLFGPFYAAGWFYRLCNRLAQPRAGEGLESLKPAQ